MKLTIINATAPKVKFATSGNWVIRKGTPKHTNAVNPLTNPLLISYFIFYPHFGLFPVRNKDINPIPKRKPTKADVNIISTIMI